MLFTCNFSICYLIKTVTFISIFVSPSAQNTIDEIFKNEEIVPDIVSISPLAKLDVKFSSTPNLDFGVILTPEETQNQPEIGNWKADPSKLYTLINIDPDATSRTEPIYRNILHWLVFNIPGNNILNGHTRAMYIGPGPPINSGLHRYIFLIYEQNQRVERSPSYPNIMSRLNFKMDDFIRSFNLNPTPLAGNYFQSQAF